jgi:threonine dehydrogenase-like Zn-dependent dehydrogenase
VRAAVHEGPRRLSIREVDEPQLGPGEVRIRVAACGICATNLHRWGREPAGLGTLPGAHGHEVAGTVDAVGSGVTSVAVGDRVCVEPAAACGCGLCAACAAGDPMRCREQTFLPVWGFSEAMAVPERGVVLVPSGLDLITACLAEPLASAVHGIRHGYTAALTGRIDGASVLVLGAGVVGLFALAAARHLGAAEVIVVARHDRQADAAAALGASRVLRDDESGLDTTLRRVRPQLVVEAAGGGAPTCEQAFAAVGRGGEVVVLGLFDAPRTLDVSAAVMRNVRAHFAVAYASRDDVSDFTVALELLRSQPGLGSLITHRFGLDEIGRAARVAEEKRSGALRVVVRP